MLRSTRGLATVPHEGGMFMGKGSSIGAVATASASTATTQPASQGDLNMPRRRLGPRSIAIFCAAQVMTSGCSFLLVRPSPSADPSVGRLQCRSRIAPILDGVGATGLALGAAYLQSRGRGLTECDKFPNDQNCNFSVGLWIPAAVAAASSIYGFWAVSHCEHEQQKETDDKGLQFLDAAMSR
jgi:hypothetical protein